MTNIANKPKKQIAISGFNGFIAGEIRKTLNQFDFIEIKRAATLEDCTKIISKCDAVINLAGSPVIKRWTTKNKKQILSSRINTTKKLAKAMELIPDGQKPDVFISASAIGIYPTDNIARDETSTDKGNGFLADVVKKWEEEAKQLENSNVRVVIARIGVVLGINGGILKQMLPLFKMGLGATIGKGNKKMSFIHQNDLIRAFLFFIEEKNMHGTYNIVAPNAVTNKEFTKSLGKRTKRAWLRIPPLALKLMYGGAAEVVEGGENVRPTNLLNQNFAFKFPTIDEALDDIL